MEETTELIGPFEEQRTPYDNSVTILYKWATYHDIEAVLVIPRPRNPQGRLTTNPDDYTYQTLLEFLTEMLKEGLGLDEILAAARQYNKFIDDFTVLMVYYDYLQSRPELNLVKNMNNAYRLFQRNKRTIGREDENAEPDRYENIEAIQADRQLWANKLQRWRDTTEQKTETINLIQDVLTELEEEPALEFSEFAITSKIFLFHPLRSSQGASTDIGVPLTVEDGLDLFNYSVPSMFAPFIRYIDEMGQVYTKVYTGTGVDDQPRYQNIVAEGREQARSVLLLTLWLSDLNSPYSEELKYAPKEEFFAVVYYLDQNHLTVEVPIEPEEKRGLIEDPEEAFARLAQALPFLQLGLREEIQVKGSFDIFNLELDETFFLDTVLIEPVMNNYLYMEESVRPFSLKRRIDLYYHPMMVDDAYINAANVSMIVSQRSEGDSKYVHISVTQAESEQELEVFFHIFDLLLRLYLRELPATQEAYARLPELTNLAQLSKREKEVDPNKATRRRSKKSILELVEKAPQIFTRNYSRSCQSYRQPVILEPEEVDEWTSTFISIKNKLEERRVIRFPKEEPSFFFGCPNDRIPYPDLTKNRDGNTLVPCCFASRNEEGESLYEDYLADRPIDFRPGAQGNNLIITNKILLPGRVGVLPVTVESVLSKANIQGRLVRYGVSYAPDSLLHCICVAVEDERYLELDEEDRQQYIREVRRYIARNIDPHVLMQELYDYQVQDIEEYLDDEDSYLDPALYYRAIEEIYNINLYVFRSAENEVSGEIDLPRYKSFHARPLRDRLSVLILKNYGSESDGLLNPQCELIVDNSDRSVVKVFDMSMTNVCHSILTKAVQTMTGQIQGMAIALYRNLYYQADHLTLYPWTAEAQIIDENGKVRAIVFRLEDGLGLTLYTIPSQPLSLPIAEDLPHIPLSRAQALFPDSTTGGSRITAYSINDQGDVVGVWIKVLEVEHAEYIPVLPERVNLPLPQIPPPSLFVMEESDITFRLRKVKRDAKILVQLIRWLYQIALQRRNTTPEEWLQSYVVVRDPPSTDSATYYDFSRLTRKLPQQEWPSSKEAIVALGRVAPTFVEGNKVAIYGQELFYKVKAMLLDYDRLTYDAFDRPPMILEDYYHGIDDFIANPQSKLFLNEADFQAWLDRNRSPESNYPLVRAILTDAHPVTPYIYRFKDRLMMVQNCTQGDQATALAIAYVWYYYRVNLGYYARPLSHVPAHIVYGLTTDGQLQILLDERGNSDSYLEIVYHGASLDYVPPRRYAALLPLQ